MNRSGPQKESRGHNIGSNWLKSSLIYSLHVTLGTEPTFHSKITINPTLPLALGVRVAEIGDFGPKSDFKHVKNEVKQRKLCITWVQSQ